MSDINNEKLAEKLEKLANLVRSKDVPIREVTVEWRLDKKDGRHVLLWAIYHAKD